MNVYPINGNPYKMIATLDDGNTVVLSMPGGYQNMTDELVYTGRRPYDINDITFTYPKAVVQFWVYVCLNGDGTFRVQTSSGLRSNPPLSCIHGIRIQKNVAQAMPTEGEERITLFTYQTNDMAPNGYMTYQARIEWNEDTYTVHLEKYAGLQNLDTTYLTIASGYVTVMEGATSLSTTQGDTYYDPSTVATTILDTPELRNELDILIEEATSALYTSA